MALARLSLLCFHRCSIYSARCVSLKSGGTDHGPDSEYPWAAADVPSSQRTSPAARGRFCRVWPRSNPSVLAHWQWLCLALVHGSQLRASSHGVYLPPVGRAIAHLAIQGVSGDSTNGPLHDVTRSATGWFDSQRCSHNPQRCFSNSYPSTTASQ